MGDKIRSSIEWNYSYKNWINLQEGISLNQAVINGREAGALCKLVYHSWVDFKEGKTKWKIRTLTRQVDEFHTHRRTRRRATRSYICLSFKMANIDEIKPQKFIQIGIAPVRTRSTPIKQLKSGHHRCVRNYWSKFGGDFEAIGERRTII